MGRCCASTRSPAEGPSVVGRSCCACPIWRPRRADRRPARTRSSIPTRGRRRTRCWRIWPAPSRCPGTARRRWRGRPALRLGAKIWLPPRCARSVAGASSCSDARSPRRWKRRRAAQGMEGARRGSANAATGLRFVRRWARAPAPSTTPNATWPRINAIAPSRAARSPRRPRRPTASRSSYPRCSRATRTGSASAYRRVAAARGGRSCRPPRQPEPHDRCRETDRLGCR